MKDKETWMWRDAKPWQFWLPQSGFCGGAVLGLVLLILWVLFSGEAYAQFAYECFPPEGGKLISTDKCPEGMQWRVIQTDPYYTAPVKRVYERPAQSGSSGSVTIITRQTPSRTVAQSTAPQAPPAQQGYSNEELSRELNERYKDYGGYKPGQTLTKGKGWYSWHK